MYPYPGAKCIRYKSKGETIMDDMQFAKYSCDIREILGKMTEKDQFANLVRNAVAYAISNSSSQTNWIARELFIDVIPEELISEIPNSVAYECSVDTDEAIKNCFEKIKNGSDT